MSSRDIEALQAEADHVTNESLASTRRMVQYATESQDIAGKTLEVLDEQGGVFEVEIFGSYSDRSHSQY